MHRCAQVLAGNWTQNLEKLSMTGQGPATPSALYNMISIPEAQSIVLAETQALPSTSANLSNAVGAILAEDVHAPEDVPPFPASIKVCVEVSLAYLLICT